MLELRKFARKPFFVDAVRVTSENMERVAEWCQGDVNTINTDNGEEKYVKVRVHRPLTDRQTQAFVGDWILYAGTGFKVYTPKAFEKSFEEVPNGTHIGVDPQVADGVTGETLSKGDEVDQELERIAQS